MVFANFLQGKKTSFGELRGEVQKKSYKGLISLFGDSVDLRQQIILIKLDIFAAILSFVTFENIKKQRILVTSLEFGRI